MWLLDNELIEVHVTMPRNNTSRPRLCAFSSFWQNAHLMGRAGAGGGTVGGRIHHLRVAAENENKPQPLFDFTGIDAAKEWQSVNDGVMGGVSEGKLKITDDRFGFW